MPCFAVAAVYSGEQNGLNQMYYFRIFNSEIITKYGLGGTGHIEINWIGLPGGATLTCSLAVNPELFFYS